MKILNPYILKELAETIEKLKKEKRLDALDTIYDLLADCIEASSKKLYDAIVLNASEASKYQQKVRKSINFSIENKWKSAFQYFDLFLEIIREAAEEYNSQYFEEAIAEKNFLFDALNRNFVRCIQVGEEILILLKNGFPDGAHARWRTLHEISAIMAFLKKYEKINISKAYFDHMVVESYKAINQYQKYHQRIKHSPISNKEIKEVTDKYNKMISLYGVEFKGDYGWASSALCKKRPNLFHIEQDVGYDIYRPFFKMASYNVHGNSKGITFRLTDNSDEKTIMIAGSSNEGFTDPAHGAAISLYLAGNTFFNVYESIDWKIIANILFLLSEKIGDSFLAIQSSSLCDKK